METMKVHGAFSGVGQGAEKGVLGNCPMAISICHYKPKPSLLSTAFFASS